MPKFAVVWPVAVTAVARGSGGLRLEMDRGDGLPWGDGTMTASARGSGPLFGR